MRLRYSPRVTHFLDIQNLYFYKRVHIYKYLLYKLPRITPSGHTKGGYPSPRFEESERENTRLLTRYIEHLRPKTKRYAYALRRRITRAAPAIRATEAKATSGITAFAPVFAKAPREEPACEEPASLLATEEPPREESEPPFFTAEPDLSAFTASGAGLESCAPVLASDFESD